MSASFILLDIGGTDIKLAIVSDGATTLENVRRVSFPEFLPSKNGRKEVDAGHLLNVIRNELEFAKSTRNRVSGILISGQMGCWTLINRLEQKSKIVSWQDERSKEDPFRAIGIDLLKVNGGENQLGVPALGALHRLRELNQENLDLRFETMCTYVSHKLCGPETTSLAHVSDAAATGLYDIYNLTWVPEKMSRELGILQYPRTTSQIEIVGHLRGTDVPIYAAVGDQQASLLGSGITRTNLIVNIGTGGQVATILRNGTDSIYKVRPFFFGDFISTRTHLPAGRFISTLLKLLNERYSLKVSYHDLKTWSLESKREIDENLLLPEHCMQLLEELNRKERDIETAVSSILRGVALAYARAAQKMLTSDHEELVFGGGVGQAFTNFQELIGAELKMNVKVSPTEETTLQGLAYLARGF